MKKINPKILQDLNLRNKSEPSSNKSYPLLGIDYGNKFCGFAFSPDGNCVFSLNVVTKTALTTEVSRYIQEKGIVKIVFGIPIAPNNQENQVCQAIRETAQKIRNKFKIPVDFQNEKFSTQEGLKFKTKKEKRADHLAAAKILEYYLES